MNKKEKLIADTLGNGEQAALAAAAHARRHRATKHAGLVAGLVAAVVVILFVARQPIAQPSIAVTQSTAKPVFEIISDQELLAQLKDQPILVLKDRTGITGIVFLADKARTRL